MTQETEKLPNDLEKVQAGRQTSAEALRKKTEEAEKLTKDMKKVQAEKDTLIEAICNPGAPPSQQICELEQLQAEVGLIRQNTVVQDEMFDIPDEMFKWDDAPLALMSQYALLWCLEAYRSASLMNLLDGTTDPKEVAIWLNLWKLVVESRTLYVEELPGKKNKMTLRPDHKSLMASIGINLCIGLEDEDSWGKQEACKWKRRQGWTLGEVQFCRVPFWTHNIVSANAPFMNLLPICQLFWIPHSRLREKDEIWPPKNGAAANVKAKITTALKVKQAAKQNKKRAILKIEELTMKGLWLWQEANGLSKVKHIEMLSPILNPRKLDNIKQQLRFEGETMIMAAERGGVTIEWMNL
ncbi:hypothetical protein HD553DRAFT_321872 [Filobasidium floriforme]|uniref:uncharacterized protein n=1 Tax=Filobasidium floriforme TaxID=5210 RepID=UPI001E8DAD76|nr:uncharacterized protein HD553DRAFT_321872 [Filobasidium floriforme]KAH8089833.1 hypothetical protein HD553DRAFT_321872 [Filobasidium floriforme]